MAHHQKKTDERPADDQNSLQSIFDCLRAAGQFVRVVAEQKATQ